MNRPRRTALLTLLVAVLVLAGGLAWHWAARPVVVMGPMVQQVTTDGFALFVATSGSKGVTARLLEGTRPHCDGLVSPQGQGRFIITFGGLEPGRSYQYEILAGGRLLSAHTVRTAPAGKPPFRFVALGDTGVGDRHQFAVAQQMASFGPDFILHVGDLIYPLGKLEENPRKFFVPYADLLAEVPLYVALGNHEYRLPGVDPVANAFVFPPNGPAGAPAERSYWFDYADARFVAVDSNNDEPFFASVIVPWLDETLREAADRWKVLFFHEPVHTQGKYPPAAKLLNTIVPVLERHGVELVLCGHNHMYERTHPVRNGAVVRDGEGTVYVTTGAGGANLAEARLPMPDTIAVWEDQEHSFTVVDLTADVLRLRQVGETGRLIDEYNVSRHKHAAATSSAPAGAGGQAASGTVALRRQNTMK